MLAPFATFAAVAAMLAVVAFAACYISARRAMHFRSHRRAESASGN
jgi:hypothetical protein